MRLPPKPYRLRPLDKSHRTLRPPITSGAVYSAINSSSSQLHNVQHFRGVTGTSEDSVTPVDYLIAPGVTGDVFFLNYYPKFENSYITIQMCLRIPLVSRGGCLIWKNRRRHSRQYLRRHDSRPAATMERHSGRRHTKRRHWYVTRYL